MLKRMCAVLISLIVLSLSMVNTFAVNVFDSITEGTYFVDAQLSCYVNAMGGVEFGAPLLESAQVNVSKSGEKSLTVFLSKSSVTIYGVTCDTFIDFSPSYVTETNGVESGTIGFYNEEGVLVTDSIDYTLSDDTALNAHQEQVHYVDSVTFPVTYESDVYNLSLYVNSNVMGTQFTLEGYPATLTVDWSSVTPEKSDVNTTVALTESNTDTADNDIEVENKNGLNIYYPADSQADNVDAQVQTYTYIAFFKEPLLVAVGMVAVIFISVGVVLVLCKGKEKTDDKI